MSRQIFSLPLLISLLISAVILLPLLNLVLSSFTTGALGVNFGFSPSNYYAAYSDPRFIPTLLNSFVYAGGSTLIALSFAVLISWIVSRTNTPLKGLTGLMPVMPLLLPPMMDNIAWIFLLMPRAGILNSFLAETFGVRNVFDAFSLPAMIWVYGLSLVPLMYLIVLPAFLLMDSSLEEAAYLTGAGPLKTFERITLPLALPAILSATIVGVLHGLRSFETPTLQGIPAGITVFVSLVYEAAELDYNYGLAVAYSTTLLALSLSLVWIYLRFTRMGEKYAAISGKGHIPRIIDLRKWRFVTLAFVLSYFIIAIVLPFSVVFITSITPTFTYEFFKSFYNHFTIGNYAAVLSHPAFLGGITNSLYIGLGTGFVVVLAGAVMSYTVHTGQASGKRVFELVGTVPLAVPGLLLSLGLLLAYFGTPLYNSVFGIFVALVIFYFPYGLRITSGALIRIHKEMNEAARIHGASWTRVFTTIALPLLKPALGSAFLYVFISSYREVGAAVLLTGPGLNYGAVTIFDYYRLGQWAESAAGSVVYAILLFVFILLAKYVFKISLRQ